RAGRGEDPKGSIVFDGEEVHARSPNELVRRGCIQGMEGRHCFAHLPVEENLLTGAVPGGAAGGAEHQLCASGRVVMSRPKMILPDEPSMGLAPQLVEEIFKIVGDLNAKA